MQDQVQLPALFYAADRSSLSAQHRYFRFTALQLILLALAGLVTIFDWEAAGGVNLSAVAAASFIVFAGVFRVHIRITRPDRTWYQGRAAAESARTLTWRYAVGGKPFPLSMSEKEVDELFVERLEDVLHDLDGLTLKYVEGSEVTPWMRHTRALPLDKRREAYAEKRVAAERLWYGNRATSNSQRASLFGFITLIFEAAAVLQGILKATGLVDVDVLSFLATVIAGLAAWVGSKDYSNLTNAYTVAARELSAIGTLLPHQDSEEEWSGFVEKAEDSISREHTLWRASRS